MQQNKNNHIGKLINIIIISAVIGGFFYIIFYLASHYLNFLIAKKTLSHGLFSIISALFLIIFGIIAIKLIINSLLKILGNYISEEKAGFFKFLFSFIAYFILILSVFTVLGIDITNFLLGATFIGVILGIASQSLLSNLFAGFVIMFGQPFKIGDRITIVTWQWGLLMSTYQHEAVKPGYTGVIKDINMLFTTIKEDNGFIMKAPNNILMQALITNYKNIEKRLVRVRFELDKKIDFEKFKINLFNYLTNDDKNDIIKSESGNETGNKKEIIEVKRLIEKNPAPVIRVVDVSLNSYFLVVEVYTPQIFEDPVRDFILSFVVKNYYNDNNLNN